MESKNLDSNYIWYGRQSVLTVPWFSCRIGLVLIRHCEKKLAVAGCKFLGYFLPSRSAILG